MTGPEGGSEAPGRRLLVLITGLELGGAERQVHRLVRGLVPRGWTVTVVSLVPVRHWEEELRAAGADVRSLGVRPGRPDPRLATRLWALLDEVRPDVLLTVMFHANVLGRVVGRAWGVPRIVSSIRNTRFGGRLGAPLVRLTDRLADLTVANSEATAATFVERGLVAPGRIRVVRNGIDVAAYERPPERRATVRAALGLGEAAFVWLCVGRLEPQKNHAMLLTAFATVRGRHPGARLLLAGDGSLREALEARRRDLGLDDAVTFLGKRDDVPDLLAAADALVLASNHEGLPNVVMEAMAAGAPVVATRVGGVPDLIEDGVTGWSVEPGDASALAAAMEGAMRADAATVQGVRERALAHVRDRYGLPAMVDAWEALLLEAEPRPARRRAR